MHGQGTEQRIREPDAREAIGGVRVEHRQIEGRGDEAERARQRRFARPLVSIDGRAEEQVEEADGKRQEEGRAEVPLVQSRERQAHVRHRAVGMADLERDRLGVAPTVERRLQRRAARDRLAVDRNDHVAHVQPRATPRPVGAPQRRDRARAVDEEAGKRRLPRQRVRRHQRAERHQRDDGDCEGPDLQLRATHVLNRSINCV